ncbi:putative tRNA splicing endonuclease subunit [Aspergillus taichungensis]|uniref:Putative tRNA splicing endonuclease subunit n=1 Tax=Aspergillus taichungensis TaxID=482145 RepID=A0A2J5I288_9EURO|nr:putative tRNA splicing endonuclease subunit [Aspergillus taichungensis]
MADTDEAAIHMPSNDSAHIDTDLSDETQDFRMLNHLTFLTDGSQGNLPKRGEKDFEPNPTLFQADILSASRQAMHNALAYPRLHHPRNQVIGIYAPDGPAPPSVAQAPKQMDTVPEDNDTQPQQPEDTTATAGDADAGPPKAAGTEMGVPAESCVYVTNPKGQYFKTIGRADRWNRVWLLPEEALYLLERGSLDIRWPISSTGCSGESETADSGIPMSLQAAYACFLGHGGLNMERFSVYTGLRRLGYTLVRAPGWYDDADEGDCSAEDAQTQSRQGPGLAGVFGRFMQWLSDSPSCPVAGPLVGLGIHRSYDDIYRKLSIIPWHDPTAPRSESRPTSPPFRVVFHVYKPSTPFRKSAPPPADFRIAVVNARETAVPTLAQMSALLESTPLDPPKGVKMDRVLSLRLRQGYRSVILAVVDQGVVSYLRVADSAFGKEKLYKLQGPKPNQKRGPPRPRAKGR